MQNTLLEKLHDGMLALLSRSLCWTVSTDGERAKGPKLSAAAAGLHFVLFRPSVQFAISKLQSKIIKKKTENAINIKIKCDRSKII